MSDAEQMGAFVCSELCLGICEHGAHNCDSGFRRLTSVEKQTTLVLFLCVPELKSENLPKTIRQTGAKADCQASLLHPQRAIGSLRSAFHSHFHSSHATTGMFWLV